MKIMTLFLMAGIGLTAAAVVPPAAADRPMLQDEDPPAAADPIAELTARVEKLEKDKAGLEARLETHQELLAGAYAWMKSLPAAGDALQGKVEQARKDGFEKAGPNPRSKKAVLDGLVQFAEAMRSGNPAVQETGDSPKNPRRR